jgi:hypothetical protein
MVVDGQALLLHLGLHHLGDQRHAAAAGGAGLGASLQVADIGDARGHRRTQLALGDVVAGADLRRFRQGVHAQARLGLAVGLRQDQEFRRLRQLDLVQHHLQQRAVFGGIAHHHRAQQVLADSETTIFL